MGKENKNNDITVREYKGGDPSLVCHLHMKVYKQLYDFNDIFEYYVMKYMADFIFEPAGGNLWVAEVDGNVVGSVAIVKAPQEGPRSAQLRWFVLDPEYQGLGLGKRLMQTAMDFCKQQGYDHVFLWTIDFLDTALHIYKRHGFELTGSAENDDWADRPITEQRYDAHL